MNNKYTVSQFLTNFYDIKTQIVELNFANKIEAYKFFNSIKKKGVNNFFKNKYPCLYLHTIILQKVNVIDDFGFNIFEKQLKHYLVKNQKNMDDF